MGLDGCPCRHGWVFFNGINYSAVPNSTVQLINPPNQAFTPNTDLVLYQIDGRPNLPSLSIESTSRPLSAGT